MSLVTAIEIIDKLQAQLLHHDSSREQIGLNALSQLSSMQRCIQMPVVIKELDWMISNKCHKPFIYIGECQEREKLEQLASMVLTGFGMWPIKVVV